MLCLTDVDFLLKFACFDLLDEMLVVYGVQREDVRVLPTARYKIPSLRTSANADGIDRAVRFIREVTTLESVAPDILEARFVPLDGVDAGERLLLFAALNNPASLLATGDKRFLRAIAQSRDYAPARQALQGRVACVEPTVRLIIQQYGFEYAKVRIVPWREQDTATKSVFGSGVHATEENVRRTLESYIQALQADGLGMVKL